MSSMLCRMTAFLTAALLLASVSGCRSKIAVNGESYSMLNEREERELVMLARETLIRNAKKLVAQDEVEDIRRMEPELRIDYRGDCSGEAVVIWDLKRIKLEVVYEGELNDSDPRRRNIIVRAMKKYPPVLDMRKEQRRRKTPPVRKP